MCFCFCICVCVCVCAEAYVCVCVEASPRSHRSLALITHTHTTQVRAGRLELPALVAKGCMPALEPGDWRWLAAMYEWEYILTRKEAFALHRFLAAPLMLGLALGLLYSRLPGPGNALGAQERLGLFVTLLLIFAFDGVRRRGAIEDRVTWEDVLAGRLTLATHVGVVCRGGVVGVGGCGGCVCGGGVGVGGGGGFVMAACDGPGRVGASAWSGLRVQVQPSPMSGWPTPVAVRRNVEEAVRGFVHGSMSGGISVCVSVGVSVWW